MWPLRIKNDHNFEVDRKLQVHLYLSRVSVLLPVLVIRTKGHLLDEYGK
jgi:hypothetical protein